MGGSVVYDFQSEEMSTAARGEKDSVGGLVEGSDVDNIGSRGEAVVGASHSDHEGIDSVGADVSNVVQSTRKWEVESIY